MQKFIISISENPKKNIFAPQRRVLSKTKKKPIQKVKSKSAKVFVENLLGRSTGILSRNSKRLTGADNPIQVTTACKYQPTFSAPDSLHLYKTQVRYFNS